MTALPNIDEEAKELNKKTRSVAYRQHIGDGYYVSVTDGVMCVWIDGRASTSEQVGTCVEIRRMGGFHHIVALGSR